jgi:hypothetical protein
VKKQTNKTNNNHFYFSIEKRKISVFLYCIGSDADGGFEVPEILVDIDF